MADDEQNGGRQRPPCAACNHRQRRCPADCVFAPYFAAHRARDFEAVCNVFGINKASKMLKNQDNEQRRGMAAEAMIWDALEWERNPVLGPQGVFQRLTDEKQALVSQRQERAQEMGLLMKQVEWQKEEIAFLETQLLDMQRSSHQNQMMMMFPGINQTASGHYGAPAHHQMVPFPPPETQIHVPNQRYGNNNNRAVQDAGDPTRHTNNGNWVGQDQREGHVMAQNHQPHHHSGQIPTEQQYYRESNGRSFDQSMMPRSLRFNNAQAIMPISNNGEGRENFNGGAGRNWEHRGSYGGSYSIPLQGGGGGGNGGVQGLGNGSNGLGPSHQTRMGNAHGGAGPRENFNGGAGRNWEHRGNHGGSYSIPLQGGGGGGGNGGVQGLLGNGNGLGPSHQTGMGNAHAGGELGADLRAHWPDNGRR